MLSRLVMLHAPAQRPLSGNAIGWISPSHSDGMTESLRSQGKGDPMLEALQQLLASVVFTLGLILLAVSTLLD